MSLLGAFDLSRDGILRIQLSLDYETVPVYTLVIQAEDEGQPPLSSTAALSIDVLDVNDNAPVFVGVPTKNEISEVCACLNILVLQKLNSYDSCVS